MCHFVTVIFVKAERKVLGFRFSASLFFFALSFSPVPISDWDFKLQDSTTIFGYCLEREALLFAPADRSGKDTAAAVIVLAKIKPLLLLLSEKLTWKPPPLDRYSLFSAMIFLTPALWSITYTWLCAIHTILRTQCLKDTEKSVISWNNGV